MFTNLIINDTVEKSQVKLENDSVNLFREIYKKFFTLKIVL